jgi:hypothetical protein
MDAASTMWLSIQASLLSTQPEAIKPSLLDHPQWVKFVLSPSGFLTKRCKACEQAGVVSSCNCMARHLFASWR